MFVPVLICLQALFAAFVHGVVNTDVSQVIDASTSIVRYVAEVKATELASEYQVVFPENWAEHLSFLSVSSRGKILKVQPPIR